MALRTFILKLNEENIKLKADNERLINALQLMCAKAESLSLWDKMDSSYYNAKQLLNQINNQ